ncbi:MAG: hypothetical protein ACNYPH_01245 [Gammaproteobacteria bacterium WSBS_2016_MAG_OTU1]
MDNLILIIGFMSVVVAVVVATWKIGTQIGGLDSRMDRMDKRMEGMDSRIDTMQTELHSINEYLRAGR